MDEISYEEFGADFVAHVASRGRACWLATDGGLGVVDGADFLFSLHSWTTQGEPLSFVAVVEVKPSIELGEYTGVEVTQDPTAIEESDVDRTLEAMREQQAQFQAVERAAGAWPTYGYRRVTAMPRRDGGQSLTSRSPMITRPPSMCSSPARQRRMVVFPQPLGPSRTMNSPSPISRETSRTATTFLP